MSDILVKALMSSRSLSLSLPLSRSLTVLIVDIALIILDCLIHVAKYTWIFFLEVGYTKMKYISRRKTVTIGV